MTKVRVTITLEKDVYEKFKKICAEKDMKLSTKINSLLRRWTEENEK